MQQVAEWLEKLGMSEYAQRFAENDIDASVLPHLTDQSLKEIGVSLGHRLKILAAIKGLGGFTPAAPQHWSTGLSKLLRRCHDTTLRTVNPVAIKAAPPRHRSMGRTRTISPRFRTDWVFLAEGLVALSGATFKPRAIPLR
jgi:hypothetical protein